MKGEDCMELAKVTSKGQITIPIEIRKKLGIKEGSKVLFLEEAGRIYLANSSMEALREAQAAFAGEAEYESVGCCRKLGIQPLRESAAISQYCKLWLLISNGLSLSEYMGQSVAEDCVM